jgi:membrane-associated phospholipid phosphatase
VIVVELDTSPGFPYSDRRKHVKARRIRLAASESEVLVPLLALLLIAALAGLAAAAVAWRYPRSAPGATAAPVVEAALHVSDRHAALRRRLRARMDPEVATGLALTAAAAVVVAGAVVVGTLALLVRGNDALRRVDAAATRWGGDHATPWSDRAIDLVTQLGETWFVVIAGLVVAAIAWRRGSRRLAVPFLIAVVAGDKLLTTAVKELVDRARPTLNPIAETLGPSFPSGHSSTAAAFFAAAALVLGAGRGAAARAALAGGAVGLAVAVACSRVLLGVHWLSDVVAGLALGWAWFAVCAIAFGGRMLTFGATAARVRVESRSRPPAAGVGSARSGKWGRS